MPPAIHQRRIPWHSTIIFFLLDVPRVMGAARVLNSSCCWCLCDICHSSTSRARACDIVVVAYCTWNQNSTDKNDGDTITLTCQSKAVPPANMQWLKWGRREPYSEGNQVCSVVCSFWSTCLDVLCLLFEPWEFLCYNHGSLKMACS